MAVSSTCARNRVKRSEESSVSEFGLDVCVHILRSNGGRHQVALGIFGIGGFDEGKIPAVL